MASALLLIVKSSAFPHKESFIVFWINCQSEPNLFRCSSDSRQGLYTVLGFSGFAETMLQNSPSIPAISITSIFLMCSFEEFLHTRKLIINIKYCKHTRDNPVIGIGHRHTC